MCGRFLLVASPAAVARRFALPALEPFPPRYNIAPTQPILVVRQEDRPRRGEPAPRRYGQLVRWGLIPAWAKDPRDVPLLFNARAETAAERNAFRGAMRHRRCLVPASGFYEWRREGRGRSTPFHLKPVGEEPIAFAAIAETFLAADGSEIDTAAILTTAAAGALAAIHERVPVVIAPGDDEARWLDCGGQTPGHVVDLLAPAPDGFFEPVPLSSRVNAVANMGPEVLQPAPESGAAEPSEGRQGSLF